MCSIRLQKQETMTVKWLTDWKCVLFCVLTHCGLQCIPLTMQRSEIREKHNLEGGGFGDFCKSCWCTCCVLMQNEKEVEQRESLLRGSSQGYQPNGGMVYPQGN